MSARANKSPDWHAESDLEKIHMLDACRAGQTDRVIEFLKGTSVDIDEGDDDNTTALQIAAAKGNLILVDTLIRDYNAQVNLANELGFTPFLHACREGHLDVAVRLKENGADETQKTKFGISALGLASAGGHLSIINFLLSLNLKINSKETNLTPTPLMAAAARSQIQAAQCLESRGAKIDYISPVLGLSAMHMALISGSADMIDALIEMGSRLDDVRLCNRDAKTIAESANNLEALCYIEQRQQQGQGIQRLIYPKMQIVDIIDRCDELEMRQLKYRDPRERQFNGITPLMYAVLLGKPKAVQYLCNGDDQFGQLDPTINVQEPELGLTALMMAVIAGDLEMIEQLLEASANANLEARVRKGGEIFTAFDLALYSQCTEALSLLFLYTYADEAHQHSHHPKHPKDSKPVHKELFNKFLHRFGLSDSEPSNLHPIEYKNRETFDSLVNSSFINWSLPLPFETANQLLASGRKPQIKQSVATADDRLNLVRNMAKIIIEKEGFLKPFPVGIPVNGDYTRLENYLISLTSKSSTKSDEFGNYQYQPTAEQNYQEMKDSTSIRSRANSNVSRERPPGYYNDPNSLFVVPSMSSLVDYDQILRYPNVQRSAPPRRQSENAHTRHRLSTNKNDKFCKSSENPGYYNATAMPVDSRTQSPLLTNNNLRPNRPFSVYSNTTHHSMPNSPAIQNTSQRRFPPKINTPTHSPKNSNPNLALRKKVPPGLLGISRPNRFDSPHTSSASAPPTPPITNMSSIQMPKSLPTTQRLPMLTMNELENRMKRLQLGSYYQNFVQQEIDPSIFIQLTLSDIQTIVKDGEAADKIWSLVQKLRNEYGIISESF